MPKLCNHENCRNRASYAFTYGNPDKYKSKSGKYKNPEISKRLQESKKEIEKQIKRIEHDENTELLEIIYMYYS